MIAEAKMSRPYSQRLEKIKQILRVKLTETIGNDRDEDAAAYLGTSVSTFRRWKNGSQMPDTETLIRIAEKTGISLDWFLLGKGNTTIDVEAGPPLVAKNNQGRYTGDILAKALNILKQLFSIDDEEIKKRSGLTHNELKNLLDSAEKPDFEQMEALYRNLGINPMCFFNDDEYWMIIPKNQLLLALAAVGYAGKIPTAHLISDIFSVPDEDAEAFLIEWREFIIRNQDRVLKDSWLAILEQDYSIAPEWILGATGAIAKRKIKQPNSTIHTQNDGNIAQNERTTALKEKNALLNELLNEKNKRLALYERLLPDGAPSLADVAVPAALGMNGVKE
jgi:transcriptional regulator with XRE-family HTH domain